MPMKKPNPDNPSLRFPSQRLILDPVSLTIEINYHSNLKEEEAVLA